MRYLVKIPWTHGRKMVVQADHLRVRHPEINRRVGQLGPFTHVEGTGRYDRKVLEIRAEGSESADKLQVRHRRDGGTGPVYDPPRQANGREANRSWSTIHVHATAEDVKKTVRMLRPQEAGAIADLDSQIADAMARARDLREKREAAVKEAFAKGHKVPLKELVDAVPAQ